MRSPDFVIGKPDQLRRWWIIPRNRFFNIYLHQTLRSDSDEALHDHPWWNLSVILKGQYLEVMPVDPANPLGALRRVQRRRGAVVLRRPEAAHRLEVRDHAECWSLFITGPRVRVWGFHCPKGWLRWDLFAAKVGNSSVVGQGCGE